METTDKQFFLTFLGVTAALVGIAVVFLVAANWVGERAAPEDRISRAQVDLIRRRIEPVGELRLGGDPAAEAPDQAGLAPATEPAAAAAPAKSGKDVYNGICQSCHNIGVAGAPIVGDIEAWAERIKQGDEALYSAVINGLGAMPPKGGNPALSEAEIEAAVDHMVEASR